MNRKRDSQGLHTRYDLEDFRPTHMSSPHLISFTLKFWALSYLAILGLQLNQNVGAIVKIPAVCLTSLRGGVELQAESEAEPKKKR